MTKERTSWARIWGAAVDLLKSVATKHRLKSRGELTCPHMRALADALDADEEWVTKRDKYDDMREECYEDEALSPEHLYFAEKNGVFAFLPKWEFHHDMAYKLNANWEIDAIMPGYKERVALGVDYTWEGYLMFLDQRVASKPATRAQVKAFKELLVERGLREKPEIVPLYPDQRWFKN